MVCQTDVWIDKPLKSHSIQKPCTSGKIHTWDDAFIAVISETLVSLDATRKLNREINKKLSELL